MYRKTVDELQNDQREKMVIDIRSEEDYTKETYPSAVIPDSEVLKSQKSYRTKDMKFIV